MIHVPKPWGTIYDSSNGNVVQLAAVSLIDVDKNKVVKSRLTDYLGRFNFMPTEGKYKISVNKEGFIYPSVKSVKIKKYKNPYFGGEFELKSKKEIVNTDIPLDRKS